MNEQIYNVDVRLNGDTFVVFSNADGTDFHAERALNVRNIQPRPDGKGCIVTIDYMDSNLENHDRVINRTSACSVVEVVKRLNGVGGYLKHS